MPLGFPRSRAGCNLRAGGFASDFAQQDPSELAQQYTLPLDHSEQGRMGVKVFLSWSGERSKKMAVVLRTWLPDVLQAVEPWMSEHDIGKGGRGLREIADELEDCNFGILCVTADNQNSQWVNFEAGALSKQVEGALVVPLLLDMKPADLTGPMTQFQATDSSTKSDVSKLMQDVNSALKDSAITQERLSRTFDRLWPELESQLKGIRESSTGSRSNPNRSNSDMLSEMLLLMRQQERRLVQLEDALRFSTHQLAQAMVDSPDRYVRTLVNQMENIESRPRVPRRRGTGLEGMVLAELQQVAAGLGIRDVQRMRKSQLIDAIKARQKGTSPTAETAET